MSIHTEHRPAQNFEEQEAVLLWHQNHCSDLGNSSIVDEKMCGYHWDQIMCWPPAPLGPLQLPCPVYFAGFDAEYNASKVCEPGGTWSNWTDYSQCGKTVEILVELEIPENTFWEANVPLVSYLSEIGYGISGSTLIVAFIVLISFKRLRCPRNMLHLHLFVSFIMRAFMVVLKNFIFERGVGPRSDFLMKNGTDYFHQKEAGNWECKSLTTVWQYFIAANYSWILMEGLYIHNVIMWALSADTSRIIVYIILGWGLPLIIVLGWAIGRVALDNHFCWTSYHQTPQLRYIILIPTICSIIINFLLFLNIFRLLMGKVRATIQEEAQRYWRLAKSTLVLVFLFGVPYFIFLGFYDFSVNQNTTHHYVHFVWLLCDQVFASSQGFIVALLYCFLNAEVRDELAKFWRDLTRIDARRAENAFPTTSCASWSSAHSGSRDRRGMWGFSRYLSVFSTCSTRPDSRTSKRTETVDCIVCEACNGHEVRSKRNSLNDVCHHIKGFRDDDLPEVEAKLINSSVSSV